MNRIIEVRNADRGQRVVQRVRWCSSFLCRLRGLTFRRTLPQGLGLLLVEGAASRLGTAIHMWAVFMPIGVAWLDERQRVVDLKIARPWRVYAPVKPARFILEGDPSMLESLAEGDRLEFSDVAHEEIAGP
ncbi:MAG: DUF192 domain-containing protein [Anaerolineales bacterium]